MSGIWTNKSKNLANSINLCIKRFATILIYQNHAESHTLLAFALQNQKTIISRGDKGFKTLPKAQKMLLQSGFAHLIIQVELRLLITPS